MRKITHVAIKRIRPNEGEIVFSLPAPNRHHNVIHLHPISMEPEGFREVQGFLDNNGLFLDRYDAMFVAEEAGQLIRKTGSDPRKLFSEDIW